ncbi:hypothetical protein HPB48_022755 [Haemaphysalis longicornis]|uniref:Uncharacterized protein n=1 Tax=Haemaphysalis longicornis TaxID=44386 RepID=A0A9J6G8B8_HAELO|nr:hypothetical protein HPB48_022755 [Haemaphysalis longicornis]
MEQEPKLLGYKSHFCPPSNRTAGKGAAQGVCTLIRKGLAYTEYPQFLGDKNMAMETCVTEIILTGKGSVTPERKQEDQDVLSAGERI